ncbi:DUF1259 domain-containing protein [Methylolobus aquaticus]|nr:DUF1259 domain-containing protein [Methylolobus aquaticus]
MFMMRYVRLSLLTFGALLHGQAAAAAAPGQPLSLDTAKIERLTGVKGKLDPAENAFKVSVPRADLNVTVAGVHMIPPMGLTSWAAFAKSGSATQVTGDLVLLEDQVSPVLDAVLAGGLEVTALHNHFLWDTPRVMFMHIAGQGNEDKLAAAVGGAFAEIGETAGAKGQSPKMPIDPKQSTLDPAPIEAILGVKGELAGGVYKIGIGRSTTLSGHALGNTMGVNTWASFAGSNERAVVDGDFVMYEAELQPVLRALRGAGIHVVAIHQHMVGESPRMMFLHYWGVGRTGDLARGLKSALAMQ